MSAITTSEYFTAIASDNFKKTLASLLHLSLFHSNPSIFVIIFALDNSRNTGKNKQPETPRIKTESYLLKTHKNRETIS
ncbi:hypothetical protein VCHA54P496_300041 [Vibrio chagasii]|nr:hypothetical protein VCHA36P166_70014 [Vibrio chagasii]CAH7237271.1 hypothetical protein VCHA54P496_300041 [Vibrio chagasii]